MPENTGLGSSWMKNDGFLLKKIEKKLDKGGQMS